MMADLLVDEGTGQDLVFRLRPQGLHACHILEFLPRGAANSLVLLEAQKRTLTNFTWNRDDYVLLGHAWCDWGHGSHHGVISWPVGSRQLAPADTYVALEGYCRDTSSFVDRIELF
jgi:hypothetical protein